MSDVLIVDDNAAFRQMLKYILLSRFPAMRVREAMDGETAIRETDKRVPDLVFMDLHLPGDNGLQLTRKMKRTYPKIHLIVITSYDTPEYREAALDAGADAFISKKVARAPDIVERVAAMFADP